VNGSGWLVLVLLLLLVGGGVAFWIRGEGTPPAVEVAEALLVGQNGIETPVDIADPGSGLRSLRIAAVLGDAETVLVEESYPGNLLSGGQRKAHGVIAALGSPLLERLPSESALRITVRDWSWRGFFSGNETRLEVPVTVDLDPPRVQVSSGLTYVKQGGAGSVNYSVSEAVAADGVQVGEHRYRGHPVPGGTGERIAIFAIPTDVPADVVPRVFAEDKAGNTATARWPVVVKPRVMPEGNVTLGASFLENVVPRLTRVTAGADLKAAFHKINTELRAANEVTIREKLADTASTPYFEGALQQLANSQVTSRFAERRTYFVEGDPVSKATHFGFDLASTAAAPITAAETGRVAHAGELGIYGNCVLVDHGLGLGTLYGHLSRIDVRAGDEVAQGSTLGLSGATGLAGGDHLHFAVLVGDTYVDPLEWWDPKWVQTHIAVRLMPQTPQTP
jgi:murein DD-endopeptidase MepM/ murein hydrolase activator NlpD